MTTFLYAFGQHYTLHALHASWLSLPILTPKKRKHKSQKTIQEHIDHVQASATLRQLLQSTGIPYPSTERQKHILTTNLKQLLIAQAQLDRLGHIPMEPQQDAPDEDTLHWTAQFDERLQIDINLLRGTNIVPDKILDLLQHPIHNTNTEHWLPATQHFACPRFIQPTRQNLPTSHQHTAQRCGTIARPVTGFIYTNHNTGRRNRHQCVQCNQQWQRKGLCYAIIITNHKHTLQIYAESPEDRLRHNRILYIARYLASYEPFQPPRDAIPYQSPPEHTTRIHLTDTNAQRLWQLLYRPLTPTATRQLLAIQASHTITTNSD